MDDTPGPLEVRELELFRVLAQIASSPVDLVNDGECCMRVKSDVLFEAKLLVSNGTTDEDCKANARLMAQSPAMFRVVERFATVDWMGEKELGDWIKECRKIVERVNAHG